MKLEIEVELPKYIAEGWEVVRIGQPVPGDDVLEVCSGKLEVIRWLASIYIFPRIILRRKINPREWWPKWLLANSMTLQTNEIIEMRGDDGNRAYWKDTSSLVDLSWIPEYLRRSGMTIKNPWKGSEQ